MERSEGLIWKEVVEGRCVEVHLVKEPEGWFGHVSDVYSPKGAKEHISTGLYHGTVWVLGSDITSEDIREQVIDLLAETGIIRPQFRPAYRLARELERIPKSSSGFDSTWVEKVTKRLAQFEEDIDRRYG
jgi:hypothetical protein